MAKPVKKKSSPVGLLADASTGAEWLHQLSEQHFRDEILKDLFVEMKRQEVIADYLYTHGPREHGVDWIVLEKGGLSPRFVGIQVKSQPIARQGGGGRDSALATKQQCVSAFEHTFDWHGTTIRLDVVELWMSAPITADAVEEFTAPLGRKISVKPPQDIFLLIERYCPKAISKIPGLVEVGYIRDMSEPSSLPIKVLGVSLNPRKHFLDPRFSRYPSVSPDRILDQRTRKVGEERPLYLEDIIGSGKSSIIVGSELSGKSYILKRIACVIAQQDQIPILADATEIHTDGTVDIVRILKAHLPWYPADRLRKGEKPAKLVVLLIDNADLLTDEQLVQLHNSTADKVLVIAAGRRSRSVKGFSTFYIAGIRNGAIQRFVRSLDIDQATSAVLMDRVINYLGRAIHISGLPVNPFTVSVMLEECRVSKRRLATPTMGRLIERFVLSQLGSHSDTTRVDYETKDQFLTQLGGKHAAGISVQDFRRRLSRFIGVHGHAHSREDFEQDILDSGLLQMESDESEFRWGHPIFREFFWVRNLVRERKHGVIAQLLQTRQDPAIAAIAGSQLANAHEVFVRLLKALPHDEWAEGSRRLPRPIGSQEHAVAMPSDTDEEELLSKIEVESDTPEEEKRSVAKRSAEDREIVEGDDTVRKKMSMFAARYVEDKHSLIVNLSAFLLNARSLTREDKVAGVLCVVRSNVRMSKHFSEVVRSFNEKHTGEFHADLLARFLGLTINDKMIGDAFLTQVFKDLFKKTQTLDERLFVIDLLVASGAVPPSDYVPVLREMNDSADTVAVYMRLVSHYYYRHHKGSEKSELKNAMKEVRRQAKGIRLAPVR